jgi:misacylated tRNA(Ala) deacylase
MTEPLFRQDAYLKEAGTIVVSAEPRGIVLEATNFYAQGGGQAGDRGEIVKADGSSVAIVNAIYDADKRTILHVPADGAELPAPGERVTARIDWDLRL